MKEKFIYFLEKLPLPICGLILALISLGNLLLTVGHKMIGIFYILAGLLLMCLVFAKIVLTPKHAIRSLRDPIIASVSPTFTMSLMVISSVLCRAFPDTKFIDGLWWFAVVLHFILMIYFFLLHIIKVPKLKMENIYPSWFITFVGIGVIASTCPAFHLKTGQIVIYFALFFYFLLLPLIIKRIFIFKQLHESALPLITILTAPGSLCLVGYLSVFGTQGKNFIIFLFILSQSIYFLTLFTIRKISHANFYPSYAAFTFPLVISATAVHLVLQNGLLSHPFFTLLSYLELLIALMMVTYVLVRYLIFLLTNVALILKH